MRNPREQYNTDRLKIIDEIFADSERRGFNLSKDQVISIVEKFEATFVKYCEKQLSIQYKWRIPFVADLFIINIASKYSEFNRLMLKTFNEEFALSYKK